MRFLVFTLMIILVVGCSAPTTRSADIDLGARKGTFILALTGDPDVRQMFEDKLVSDMTARDLKAFASYPDLPDVSELTRLKVIQAATGHKALFILVVEEVSKDHATAVSSKGRITHEHPTLKEFFEHNKPSKHDHDPDDAVFVEVSAFQVKGNIAELVWSGTTWSFQTDGEGGAISGISQTIADAIAVERKKFLERQKALSRQGS